MYGSENSNLKKEILERVNQEGMVQDLGGTYRPGQPPDPHLLEAVKALHNEKKLKYIEDYKIAVSMTECTSILQEVKNTLKEHNIVNLHKRFYVKERPQFMIEAVLSCDEQLKTETRIFNDIWLIF